MFSKRISVLFSTGFVLSWIDIPRGLSKNHLFIVTPTWNFNFSSLCHSSKCFCLFSLSLFFLCVDYTWQSFLMSEIQHHYSNAEKQASHNCTEEMFVGILGLILIFSHLMWAAQGNNNSTNSVLFPHKWNRRNYSYLKVFFTGAYICSYTSGSLIFWLCYLWT